jgi:hypothetical protein
MSRTQPTPNEAKTPYGNSVGRTPGNGVNDFMRRHMTRSLRVLNLARLPMHWIEQSSQPSAVAATASRPLASLRFGQSRTSCGCLAADAPGRLHSVWI